MDIFTHRRKLTETKLARLTSLMRKEDEYVGAAFLAHFRRATLHTSYLLFFCSPAFLCWGKNGGIICNTTEKLHFQAGAGDEEVGGVEVVLLVLLTCLLVLLVLLVVENTGIFTLQ